METITGADEALDLALENLDDETLIEIMAALMAKGYKF